MYDDELYFDIFPTGSTNIHFVRAGRNGAWNLNGAKDRLQSICEKSLHQKQTFSKPNERGIITLHAMEHCGHWLHAEDLKGCLDIIEKNSIGLQKIVKNK